MKNQGIRITGTAVHVQHLEDKCSAIFDYKIEGKKYSTGLCTFDRVYSDNIAARYNYFWGAKDVENYSWFNIILSILIMIFLAALWIYIFVLV